MGTFAYVPPECRNWNTQRPQVVLGRGHFWTWPHSGHSSDCGFNCLCKLTDEDSKSVAYFFPEQRTSFSTFEGLGLSQTCKWQRLGKIPTAWFLGGWEPSPNQGKGTPPDHTLSDSCVGPVSIRRKSEGVRSGVHLLLSGVPAQSVCTLH